MTIINYQKMGGVTALLATTLAVVSPVQALTLYSQTDITTDIGAGFNGSDVSNLAPGGGTLGFSAPEGSFRLADDFSVPVEGWVVDAINVFGYRTASYGFPPASPFTGISVNIWDGIPGNGGSIIASSTSFQSTNWTGIYRVPDSANFLSTARPVMNIVAAFPSLSLSQGTYWVDFALTNGGSAFVPPVMTPSGELVVGNARQFNQSTTTWANALEGTIPIDVPFAISGTVVEPVPFEFESATGLAALGGYFLLRRSLKKKSPKN